MLMLLMIILNWVALWIVKCPANKVDINGMAMVFSFVYVTDFITKQYAIWLSFISHNCDDTSIINCISSLVVCVCVCACVRVQYTLDVWLFDNFDNDTEEQTVYWSFPFFIIFIWNRKLGKFRAIKFNDIPKPQNWFCAMWQFDQVENHNNHVRTKEKKKTKLIFNSPLSDIHRSLSLSINVFFFY